jgi:hypothetical protein
VTRERGISGGICEVSLVPKNTIVREFLGETGRYSGSGANQWLLSRTKRQYPCHGGLQEQPRGKLKAIATEASEVDKIQSVDAVTMSIPVR